MTGKTHCFASVAAAVTVMQPSRPTTLLVGGALALLGGLTPDVDLVQSKMGQKVSKFIIGIFSILLLLGFLKQYAYIDVFSYVSMDQIFNSIFRGVLLYLLLCSVGLNTKHRSFTHSILGSVLFTFCISLVTPKYYLYFLVGYVSHLLLDVINKKGIQLFFPLEEKVCIPLVKATNKYVNGAIVAASTCILFVYIMQLVGK